MSILNWNTFKSKFNGYETFAFESLCYQIFCNEYNYPNGIFRYKNQAGIETEPIDHNGKQIGFQAKFFELSISADTIINSMETAKSNNPKLDSILIYTNIELSESSKKGKKKPEYQIKIETRASELEITIIWRVPSNLEIILNKPDLQYIKKYFFSQENGALDAIDQMELSNDRILSGISDKITFSGKTIKLDRQNIIDEINHKLLNVNLIQIIGSSGSGKSAIIKGFISQQDKDNVPIFIFNGAQFTTITHVNELFRPYGNINLSEFIEVYSKFTKKYIIIDSAEKIAEIAHKSPVYDFIKSLQDTNWKFILATKTNIADYLFNSPTTQSESVVVNQLNNDDLTKLSVQYKIELPQNKVKELILTPFYLNLFLIYYDDNTKSLSLTEFKESLWINKIKGNISSAAKHRENILFKLVKLKSDSGEFYVHYDDIDHQYLDNLESDGVIGYDHTRGKYYLLHDIYEEWVLFRIIQREFINFSSAETFFNKLGDGWAMRRCFRDWFGETIQTCDLRPFVSNAITYKSLTPLWHDEILISVLLHSIDNSILELYENKCIENVDYFSKVLSLLSTSCKEIDEVATKSLQEHSDKQIQYILTRPKGYGWVFIINLINSHKELITSERLELITKLTSDWNSKFKTGITTKDSSQILLYIYQGIIDKTYSYSIKNLVYNTVVTNMLHGAHEIKDKLKNLIDDIISNPNANEHKELVQAILVDYLQNPEIIYELPGSVIKLANKYWLKNESDHRQQYSTNVENYFGITDYYSFNYHPSSAYQTPLLILLNKLPVESLKFIVGFINSIAENYYQSGGCFEIIQEVELIFGDGHTQKQYISTKLWNMYRGTNVSTYLLESIHMALEDWLYKLGKSKQFERLEMFCEYLLRNSKSASTSSIVNSLVLAFPSKLFKIAKILISVREFLSYDLERSVQENQANTINSFNFRPQDKIYFDERNISNQYPHRKLTLENIGLYYQVQALYNNEPISDIEKRRLELSLIFDKYKQVIQELDQNDESVIKFRFCLARMDYRNQKINDIKDANGNTYRVFEPILPPDLEKQANEAQQNLEDMSRSINLLLWAHARFKLDSTKYNDPQYEIFETHPENAYYEAKQIIDYTLANPQDEDFKLRNWQTPILTTVVLLRDFFDIINDEIRNFCKEIILTYASAPIMHEVYNYSVSDGVAEAINTLPVLMHRFPHDRNKILKLTLLLLLSPYNNINGFMIKAISSQLWTLNEVDANFIFLKFLHLQPIFSQQLEIFDKTRFQTCQPLKLNQLINDFYTQSLDKFKKPENNYPSLENIKLECLNDAFLLLPLEINSYLHLKFLEEFIPKISSTIFINNDRSLSYEAQFDFLKKIADVLFYLKGDHTKIILAQLMLNLNGSQNSWNLLKNLIYAADRAHNPCMFWNIWNQLYPKIIDISRNGSYYNEQITCEYLLAGTVWMAGITDWHSLEEANIINIFEAAMRDLGSRTEIFYSITKFTSGIGKRYVEDGITWIANLLKNNTYNDSQLLQSACTYLELTLKAYIESNTAKIQESINIKNNLLLITNFLVNQGSTIGSLLRNNL